MLVSRLAGIYGINYALIRAPPPYIIQLNVLLLELESFCIPNSTAVVNLVVSLRGEENPVFIGTEGIISGIIDFKSTRARMHAGRRGGGGGGGGGGRRSIIDSTPR